MRSRFAGIGVDNAILRLYVIYATAGVKRPRGYERRVPPGGGGAVLRNSPARVVCATGSRTLQLRVRTLCYCDTLLVRRNVYTIPLPSPHHWNHRCDVLAQYVRSIISKKVIFRYYYVRVLVT